MTNPPVIALLTDFGVHDHYVSVMKGVILSICPQAQIVDITHNIPPQNIHKAAYTLFNAYAYFPEDAIFVCVVDPGVGSARRAIAVRHQGKVFITPDNGLLTYILGIPSDVRPAAVELTKAAYRLPNTSATFHGRDIFAPAAAHLANGITFFNLGSKADNLVELEFPVCNVTPTEIAGSVWDIDIFGNIVTTIGRLHWLVENTVELQPAFMISNQNVTLDVRDLRVELAGRVFKPLVKTYADLPAGQPGILVGSEGFLEIALREGHAATRLGARIGDSVKLYLR